MKTIILCLVVLLSACTFGFDPDTQPLPSNNGGQPASSGSDEVGIVTDVIDGDTIDVDINGQVYRIRYIGVNTPERDEVCYSPATQANAALVEGQQVRLVRDQSETDRFDRLLRYVYVGDTFVNAQMVAQGYAEAVLYEPDDAYYSYFLELEQQSRSSNLGCHPTGIFNDGSDTR